MNIFNILRNIIDKAEEVVNDIKQEQEDKRRVFYLDVKNVPEEKVKSHIEQLKTEVKETAEYTDLKNKLIASFYMLPELLYQYNITEDDINTVISNMDSTFLSNEMDSSKMSIIFNNILEEYSSKVLIDMGVINYEGHMKVNPIDFCYKSASTTSSNLTDHEKEVKFMTDALCIIGYGKEISKEILKKQDEKNVFEFEKIIYAISRQDNISDSDIKRLHTLYIKVLEYLITYNEIKDMNDLITHEYYSNLTQSEKISIERYFLKNNGED